MNILLYVIIFLMGTVFGSFFSLAVYRIPLNKNITHERSFCPNCNHRLEFLDLIPVLSYIFLKGKCRYCGKEVRIRYLILEIISGIIFLLGFLSLGVKFPYIDMQKIAYFISFIFIYITITLVVGIDKEHRSIDIRVIIFGIIMQTIYILYLYVVESTNIYRYGIYLSLLIVLIGLSGYIKKKENNISYLLGILIFCIYINMCVGLYIFLMTVLITIICASLNSAIYNVMYKIKDRADILEENIKKKTSIGFFLGISTIAIIITENVLLYVVKG